MQTEDSGVDNPHLFTHLFHGGVIISSRRMDYDAASEVETVKSLMQSQHKAVLKDLKIGTFDQKIDDYLGNDPELLPRKGSGTSDDTDPSAKAPETETSPIARSQRFKTELDDEIEATIRVKRSVVPGDTVDMDEAAAQAIAQFDALASVEPRAAAPQADPRPATPSIPPVHAPATPVQTRVMPPGAPRAQVLAASAAPAPLADTEPSAATGAPASALNLDLPMSSTVRGRVHTPTPVAIRVLGDDELGDPMVTFAPRSGATAAPPSSAPAARAVAAPGAAPAARAPVPPIVAPSAKPAAVPSAVPSAIPNAIDDASDSSGSYHIRRPNRGTAERFGRARTVARSSPDPTPAKAFPTARASGKAANPQPGRPRSSVVVSRPAVIIGAPPSMVGGDNGKQRAPAARKARDGNLFGKDLISEKSLDEVIMAYLSEDGSDE